MTSVSMVMMKVVTNPVLGDGIDFHGGDDVGDKFLARVMTSIYVVVVRTNIYFRW